MVILVGSNYAFCICSESEYILSVLEQYNSSSYIQYTYWCNESIPSSLWRSIGGASLLSKPILVLLRNAHKLHKEDYRAIALAVHSNRAIFCLFVLEQEHIPSYIESSSLYKEAQAHGNIHTQVALTRKTLGKYIQTYCTQHGYTIDEQALAYIQDILPCTVSAIHNELSKLMLSSLSSCHIDYDTVVSSTSYAKEHTIWYCIEQILRGGDITEIWLSLIADISFFSLSAMLQRELRIAGALISGDPISLPQYLMKGKQSLAKILHYKGIAMVYTTLLTLEGKIKNGAISEEQAIEYMICFISYTIHVIE